jgi:hypothetical protein
MGRQGFQARSPEKLTGQIISFQPLSKDRHTVVRVPYHHSLLKAMN